MYCSRSFSCVCQPCYTPGTMEEHPNKSSTPSIEARMQKVEDFMQEASQCTTFGTGRVASNMHADSAGYERQGCSTFRSMIKQN